MSVARSRRQGNTSRWGWGLLLAIGALLVLDATWLFFAVVSPAVFEQDTGVSLSRVEAEFPQVVETMAVRGRLVSVHLSGLGLIAVLLASSGMAGRGDGVRGALWVFVLVLAAAAALFLSRGRLDLGIMYLVLAGVAAAGQLMVGRSKA